MVQTSRILFISKTVHFELLIGCLKLPGKILRFMREPHRPFEMWQEQLRFSKFWCIVLAKSVGIIGCERKTHKLKSHNSANPTSPRFSCLPYGLCNYRPGGG